MQRSLKLLGILDVRNVPCARESVLYGSLGGLTVGLGHFGSWQVPVVLESTVFVSFNRLHSLLYSLFVNFI